MAVWHPRYRPSILHQRACSAPGSSYNKKSSTFFYFNIKVNANQNRYLNLAAYAQVQKGDLHTFFFIPLHCLRSRK